MLSLVGSILKAIVLMYNFHGGMQLVGCIASTLSCPRGGFAEGHLHCPCPTQMVKPKERNTRFVDCVMTVPKGTLYPMCGMNLAFDRCVSVGAAVLCSTMACMGYLGTQYHVITFLHCMDFNWQHEQSVQDTTFCWSELPPFSAVTCLASQLHSYARA